MTESAKEVRKVADATNKKTRDAVAATGKTRDRLLRLKVRAKDAAAWSAEQARDRATRVATGARNAAARSAEKTRDGAARVADEARDAATWSTKKVRDGTVRVTEGAMHAANWSAEKARVGAAQIAEGTKDAAGRSAEKARQGAAQVADGVKDAAAWSAEKARIGASDIAEGATDTAAWSAERSRDGAKQVADGAKDAAAWSAEKARQGAATGLSVTCSYGAPVITGVTAGVLAVSEKVSTAASFQKMLAVMRSPIPFWDAHGHLSRFSLNLDWANVDPTKYLYAGTRGTSRGLVEAQRVWETIPEQIRAKGPEATAKYLEGKDWSHIQPYSEGGSHSASNGLFEEASLNRARGSDRMTPGELEAAQRVLKSNAFHATLLETARCAMEGALTAAAIAAVMAVLEYGLQYQRREISEDELYAGDRQVHLGRWNQRGGRFGTLGGDGNGIPGDGPGDIDPADSVDGDRFFGPGVAPGAPRQGLVRGVPERTAAQATGTSILADGPGEEHCHLRPCADETASG